MKGNLKFSGPARHRFSSAAMLGKATAEVCLRRLFRRQHCPSWNLMAELSTEIAKRQLLVAFRMSDVNEARSYLDSVTVDSGVISKVAISKVDDCEVRGRWFIPKHSTPEVVILFLHGGGYSFYPRGFYDGLSAMLALSAKSRVFVPDYPLSPEHRFPAQLNYAANAYEWLLTSGIHPSRLVIAGDSAGGNLTLSLLLYLRESQLPPPALAVCLSPATDFGTTTLEAANAELDWITPEMALRWADWFCSPQERNNPLVSPVNADLRGLPPVYIQAGGAEILLASIQEFVTEGKRQGADISLEIWPDMNHDFQAFGYDVPQSREALRRIGEVVAERLSTMRPKTTSAL
jgi:acetyl esterase/lipase